MHSMPVTIPGYSHILRRVTLRPRQFVLQQRNVSYRGVERHTSNSYTHCALLPQPLPTGRLNGNDVVVSVFVLCG